MQMKKKKQHSQVQEDLQTCGQQARDDEASTCSEINPTNLSDVFDFFLMIF